MPPQGLPNANVNASPGPTRILGITFSIMSPISGISMRPVHPKPPRSSATSVAFRLSLPRRYSIWAVSPGSSFRASSMSVMPGPESPSSSAFAPARLVLLKRVMISPTLRPALSAGPSGVMASIRAPTLSLVASARISTITPIRPRLSLKEWTPNGPVSTRTRGRVLGRRGVPCVVAAAGTIMQAASAATVKLRIISSPPGSQSPT